MTAEPVAVELRLRELAGELVDLLAECDEAGVHPIPVLLDVLRERGVELPAALAML